VENARVIFALLSAFGREDRIAKDKLSAVELKVLISCWGQKKPGADLQRREKDTYFYVGYSHSQ